jgi:hypothetical protein
VLDASPLSRDVWQTALTQARRRYAPMPRCKPRSLGLREELDGYFDDTQAGAADVGVSVLPLPPNVTELPTQTTGADQLVIVGKSNPSLIAELVDLRGAHSCGRRIAR